LHFLVAPVALDPCVQTHLLPAEHRLVPNMQPALSTGEKLLFTVKGSTDPAKVVASAFRIRSPALSIDAVILTKRTSLILVREASLVRAGKHNTNLTIDLGIGGKARGGAA